MYAGFRVIDSHAHFPYGPGALDGWYAEYEAKHGAEKARILRQAEESAKEKWRRENVFDDPTEESSVDVLAKKWSAELDRYGIEKIVFVSGGGNDVIASVVKSDPRFVGYAQHDPFEPGAAEKLRHAVEELGLSGYKLWAPLVKEPINDERAFPVWQVAEELRIPVLIHFGVLGGAGGIAHLHNANPLLLHDVAKAFPGVNFIVPHFGAGYPTELFQLARACSNVYTDTSGSLGWTRWMAYEISMKHLLRRAMETFGIERVLFGTDSSWFPRGFCAQYLNDLIRDCRQIGLRDADIQKILAENAERVLFRRDQAGG